MLAGLAGFPQGAKEAHDPMDTHPPPPPVDPPTVEAKRAASTGGGRTGLVLGAGHILGGGYVIGPDLPAAPITDKIGA